MAVWVVVSVGMELKDGDCKKGKRSSGNLERRSRGDGLCKSCVLGLGK